MEKILYRCDPDKNTECRKMFCSRHGGFGGNICRATTRPEYAERDEAGNLIIEPRLRDKIARETARDANGTD